MERKVKKRRFWWTVEEVFRTGPGDNGISYEQWAQIRASMGQYNTDKY